MDKCLYVFINLAIFASLQHNAAARTPLLIVNGTTAEEGEFPYMVQLRDFFGYFICGGAIIGPEWILTAGHCVQHTQVGSIVYGTNKLYNEKDVYPSTSISVLKKFTHPNYQSTSENIPIYDVGILQLEEPIPFSTNARAVQLAEANQTIPFHIQGVLAGWGVNMTYGDTPPYLQKINRSLLTDEECTDEINSYSGKESFISMHHLCSDDYYDGECNGDSGSPLVINSIQYGIVSWSYKPCGIVPGAYSRIVNPEYRNWIKNVTNI